MYQNPYFTPHVKLNFKWITDLHLTPRKKFGTILMTLDLAMISYRTHTHKRIINKKKLNKFDFIKIRNFALQMALTKIKRPAKIWDKILIKYMFYKGVYQKRYRGFSTK